jgi:hypothetical protein
MRVPFSDLDEGDLHVEAVYQGDTALGIAGEPLAKLLPVGNRGGFRAHGSPPQGGREARRALHDVERPRLARSA